MNSMVQRKKSAKESALLTEVELELMTAVWKRGGECTVKEVQESLPQGRDLAYTSVATVMKILEHKKVLASSKKEKAHVYRALLSKDEYESTTLKHLAQNVFEGDSGSMVMKLLNETDLSADELKAIRSFLNERLARR
jgi:predicted transcriptional regulator